VNHKPRMNPIESHLAHVRQRIATAAAACGRNPADIQLLAVSKTRPATDIATAYACGQRAFGENYLQEAEKMIAMLGETAKEVRWHMIGDLQKNKMNRALKVFDLVQTLSSFDKAEALNHRAAAAGKVMPVYVEINSGQEVSKKGVDPDFEKVKELVVSMTGLEYISVEGLMTMGPMTSNPEDSRPYFRKAKKIFDNSPKHHFHNRIYIQLPDPHFP